MKWYLRILNLKNIINIPKYYQAIMIENNPNIELIYHVKEENKIIHFRNAFIK